MKCVLVTGIGGVVGQGILRNIRFSGRDVHLIGTDVSAVTPGNHLCDSVHTVPYAYDTAYIKRIRQICDRTPIDLIIPSTDYEAYYLALNQDKLNCTVACSPPEVTKMCLDKYTNFLEFRNNGIPFASSFLPSQYKIEFDQCIVKPREGRGSRGIFINPDSTSNFDDTQVVQELLVGPEITSTFYATKTGQNLGSITMVRQLDHGNTVRAEVSFEFDNQIDELVDKMLLHYPFRGSCNIQCIVTPSGIVPFEINCRISGTNSIRSQFGFKDVEYTLQEYLYNELPETPQVTSGSALRVMLDVVYPNKSLSQITNNRDDFYIR